MQNVCIFSVCMYVCACVGHSKTGIPDKYVNFIFILISTKIYNITLVENV